VAVDGVNATIWRLAADLAALGHRITLPVSGRAPEGEPFAHAAGIHLAEVPHGRWNYDARALRELWDAAPPDIVHCHSVFLPHHAALCRELRRRGVPYAITPHAGLLPEVLRRGRLKKALYAALLERPRFAGAQAIVTVVPGEEASIRAYVPEYTGVIQWVANPLEPAILAGPTWRGNVAPPRIVFLGRLDVEVKGLDILVAIASQLPQVQFEIYGPPDARSASRLEALRRAATVSVHFRDPLYGAAKAELLAGATLYLQTSRWEGFPVSVAEAMYLGVPCAIAEGLVLAQTFREGELGLTIPREPAAAARQIAALLADEARLRGYAQRGRQYARANFAPGAAAAALVTLYEDILAPRYARPGALAMAG